MANKPFFVPQKEINLFDAMNEELIDEIVGQTVDIYKISIDDTDENIYGESSTKYYDQGFRVNCLINWSEPVVNKMNLELTSTHQLSYIFIEQHYQKLDFFQKLVIL